MSEKETATVGEIWKDVWTRPMAEALRVVERRTLLDRFRQWCFDYDPVYWVLTAYLAISLTALALLMLVVIVECLKYLFR